MKVRSIICVLIILALAVGNYFAHIYENLITVFLSGSDYEVSLSEEELGQKVAAEGAVLLKNEDNTLPLKGTENIAFLGQNCVDFMYGGAGSGSASTVGLPTLKDSLEKAGFTINTEALSFYTEGPGKNYRKTYPDISGAGEFNVNEVPASEYTEEFKNSLKKSDVAVVSLGRGGGESSDLPTGLMDTGYKYLEADKDELDMLRLACQTFDTVILLVNASNAMELGFLDNPEFANIKAALWVGAGGQVGIYAIGEILAGKVNPSGRLVDTYAYDSKSAPSFQNFGDYTYTNPDITDRHYSKYLVYAEGIYIGYKYYETRYEDVVLNQGNAGDYDYSETVQFPFGYGLSYTNFEWSNYKVLPTADGKNFEITLTVTNKGSYAGKDVVEIYLQSPYTDYDKQNKVEKASVSLVGYHKTDILEPGASEDVKIIVSRELLKSYDYTNAKTYILDAGTYYLAAGKNAHNALNNIMAAKGVNPLLLDGESDTTLVGSYEQTEFDKNTYSVSQATGFAITNEFEDADVNYYLEDNDKFSYLSRNDWMGTMPQGSFKNNQWTAPDQLVADLQFYRGDEVVNDPNAVMPTFNSTKTSYTVQDLINEPYESEKWDDLVNQLSWAEMTRLIRVGGYSTIKLDKIGLPKTQDKDGPSGISATLVGGTSCMSWPVEVVFASTWNDELIEDVGEMIGEQSIAAGVAGWYAPGINIHRSPYSGRNFEYFSEDGFLSGKIGAAEMRGVRSKGLIAYMKHFAVNDQEANRYGGAMFANEQAIREIMLKGFELTTREGDAIACMASMNRLGARWAGAHKGLMTNVLRNEWGFQGMAITDQASVSAMFYQDMISGLAGGTDIWLNTNATYWKLDEWKENPTVMTHAHNAAKNIIYTITNSHAVQSFDGTNTAVDVQDEIPMWKIALYALDVVVVGACLITIFTSKKRYG